LGGHFAQSMAVDTCYDGRTALIARFPAPVNMSMKSIQLAVSGIAARFERPVRYIGDSWQVGSAFILVGAVFVFSLFNADSRQAWWLSLIVMIAFSLFVLYSFFANVTPIRLQFYFASQTILLALLIIIQTDLIAAPMLVFVTVVQVMMFYPLRQAAAWVAVWLALLFLAAVLLYGIVDALPQIIPFVAGYFFFAAFARATRLAEQAQMQTQDLYIELQATHSKLQRYAEQIKGLSAAEERNHIARELHDTLGHRLTVVAVQLEAAQRFVQSDAARTETIISTVREEVRAALVDLRQTVSTLRNTAQGNNEARLDQAIRQLVMGYEEATGSRVSLSLPGVLPRLTPDLKVTLIRAVQEALTNIQKHAETQHIWVTLIFDNIEMILSVEDNGKGFDLSEPSGGFGLAGIRERVEALSGSIEIESLLGSGTRLTICLPVDQVLSND
jgi:signal transduction histidine kinase